LIELSQLDEVVVSFKLSEVAVKRVEVFFRKICCGNGLEV